MKILYIATAYDRWPGDVITPWLVETIHRLRAEGVVAEVLAPSYRGLGSGVIDGVLVHRFRYAPRRWEDLTHDQTAPDRVRERPAYLGLVPGYALAGAVAARRLAANGGYDLVHVHWPIPHAVFGLAARRSAGIPLVCSFHGVELTWTRRQLPFLAPFLRHVIRISDAVTANSSYTEAMIRGFHDRPIERIPFGAACEAPAEAGAHRAGERGDGPFELLFVGRLVERKGVHYLLDALARLRGARPVHLRVVGDGPMRPALEERARELGLGDRVRFDGFVASEELARRFAAADAFVLPAVVDAKGDTEGLGVVLIEALTHRVPVIASAAGGIVDIVRDDETGLLVPPANGGALAGAIERLVADPALARRLAEGGRAHVEKAFSWPAVIGRLTALYHGLVARPRRGSGRQAGPWH